MGYVLPTMNKPFCKQLECLMGMTDFPWYTTMAITACFQPHELEQPMSTACQTVLLTCAMVDGTLW
jgi:Na+-translocating ferredoxin:NAD+ oxidoreductase RnfC subunit